MVLERSDRVENLRDLDARVSRLESLEDELQHALTQYKHAQQVLDNVQASLKCAEIGLWNVDLRTNKVWYSREWKRLLGYEEHEMGDLDAEFLERVHPEDLPLITQVTERYCKSPSGVYEAEFRMRHRDGGWRWMLSRAQLVRDEQGQPSQFAGGYFDITVRRAARQHIIQERDLSQHIIDSLPGVFYLFGEDGRFLYWNHNLERVSGYTAQEMQSLHALDLFRGETRDRVAERISHVFSAGEDFVEADLISKDGASSPYYFTGKRIRFNQKPCLIGMGIDITERKRAESELLTSQRRYAALVNDIDGIVWEADPSTFRFTFVSEFAESLLGYTVAQWYEPGFWVAHLHPADREATLAFCIEHTRRGESHDLEYRMLANDGRTVWVRDLITVESESGRPQRLRGVMIDVTQRKQSEQARAELESRLRQTQKMEALGTLAGGIAHDFNNLLAAINGNAHLALDEARQQRTSIESLEEILRAGQRAKDLVQRILTFSRPDEQQLRPLNISATVEDAAQLLRSTLPAGVDLAVDAEPGLPSVLADASQIHQIVLNLATNAWHAMGGQNGRIDIRVDRCSIGERSDAADLAPGEYVCLRVRDTAAGMDEATLSRIFEPFFTTKGPGMGTGLGLSVVHGIVRNHGGAIKVESSKGKGTTFWVYLPTSSCVAVDDDRPSEAGHERGHGQHILYIDDEESLVYLMQRFLGKRGYRVTACISAIEALQRFRADPDAFDLVITDSNMPEMSGLDVAKELLRIRPAARVVLTSGYLRPEDIARAREAGITEVVLKPNSVDELASVVHRLMR